MGLPDNELARRILSASVIIPVCLGMLWLGHGFAALLCGVVGLALTYELARMHAMRVSPPVLVAMGCSLLASLACMVSPVLSLCLGVFGGVALAFSATVGRWQIFSWAIGINLAAAGLAWLRIVPENGFLLCLTLLLLVWATDIGAYFVGRALKGPLLMPLESPHKTWSGAIGGLLAAILTGLAIGVQFQASLLEWGLWAICVSCVAQIGDWTESRLKRKQNLKHSSNMIPGHGGILDRLDSLIATVPLSVAVIALVPAWHPQFGTPF